MHWETKEKKLIVKKLKSVFLFSSYYYLYSSNLPCAIQQLKLSPLLQNKKYMDRFIWYYHV